MPKDVGSPEGERAVEIMSTQTIIQTTGQSEIHHMLDNLVSILGQELQHSRKLSQALRRRVEAEDRDDFNEREQCLVAEKEAVNNLVMVDRERIAAVGELSLALGCRREKPMRIAELILYVEPEYRDELLDVRELLRDCAEEIEALNNVNSRFQRFAAAGMKLYLGIHCEHPVDLEEVLASGAEDCTDEPCETPVPSPAEAPCSADELPEGFNLLLDEIFGEE